MSTFLENLPDINFAEKDTAIIEAEIFARFEEKLGRKLAPGDPWRQTLLSFVYWLSMARSNVDFAGKQNLLKYASQGYLQNLGAWLGVKQSAPTFAGTTLKFTLSTVLPHIVAIPQGTRATPGGNIFFATNQYVEIPAGQLSVSVNATCTTAGSIGNGFAAGQVNRLVDPFSFSQSVENINATQGGADVEDLEALRARIQIAPESFSTAGPREGYIYWAKTASQLIIDVAVKSPSPGVVDIIPLLEGGEIPEQSLLAAVYAECNDERRRPLTDMVVVRPPEIALFPVKLKYYIARSNAAAASTIQGQVSVAVDEFVLWQKSKLGRDINPSRAVELIKGAGAKRVDLEDLLPKFTPLQYFELGVADIDNFQVEFGGIEDD